MDVITKKTWVSSEVRSNILEHDPAVQMWGTHVFKMGWNELASGK